MVLKWLTVIALSVTPDLIAGVSAAMLAGIGFGFSAWILIPVVIIANFSGMLFVIKLSEVAANIPWLKSRLEKFRKPRAIEWSRKWGPWGGLLLGVSVVGTIPILIALKWMLVETRRLILPLAVSTVLYAFIYYFIILLGWTQWHRISSMG